MLCRKFKNILFTKISNNTVYHPLVQKRSVSKWFEVFSGENMTSSSRLKIFRDMVFTRIFSAWARGYMFRRCRKERGVREMITYFRNMFFRPRTHFLVYASVAYKKTEEKSGPPKRCSRNIRDKDMQKYIADLDGVEELSRVTLFCEGCDRRLHIDSNHTGPRYCDCPNSKPAASSYDGWLPYMETADIVIWRKEYKPGGLFAYKVYGRYKHVRAEDFALIQVDGSYRKVWDDAVASISVVEENANGVDNQYILHWVVLWPRLFTNRDYVYIRRHKEFTVKTKCLTHKDAIFPGPGPCTPLDKSSVHAQGKMASEAQDLTGQQSELKENKVYVIVSRSCAHPAVPETNKAVRVMEYWSHMVITSLNGPDMPGMEFVLTYYDEPAVGGLPTAVTSWAMGRAGPAFVEKMRIAAETYRQWKQIHRNTTIPEFKSYSIKKVSYEAYNEGFCEDKMESERNLETDTGVETDMGLETDTAVETDTGFETDTVLETDDTDSSKKEQSTQTIPVKITVVLKDAPSEAQEDDTEIYETQSYEKEQPTLVIKGVELSKDATLEDVSHRVDVDEDNTSERDKSIEAPTSEKDSNIEEDSDETKQTWWRYLYPLYYFV